MGRGMYLMFWLCCVFKRAGVCTLCSCYFVFVYVFIGARGMYLMFRLLCVHGYRSMHLVFRLLCVLGSRGMYLMFRLLCLHTVCSGYFVCTACSGYCVCVCVCVCVFVSGEVGGAHPGMGGSPE